MTINETTVAASETLTAVYTVPAANVGRLEAAIADLNKRARRLRVPEIIMGKVPAYTEFEYAFGNPNNRNPREYRWVKEDDAAPGGAFIATGRARVWFTVTVTGAAPKLAGWSFVGTLNLVNAEGTTLEIIRALPGREVPREFRGRGPVCDHCKTARRRNDTFVVCNEAGVHKAVGRNCLADFLGHKNPHAIAALAEFWFAIETIGRDSESDSEPGMGGGCKYWSLEHYLSVVACAIRGYGWLSKAKARETDASPTANIAWGAMVHPKSRADFERDCGPVSEADAATAAAAMAWAADLHNTAADLNDYLYSINVIARSAVVEGKTDGLAASIVSGYLREVDRAAMAAREANSVYFGEIGKRAEFTLTLATAPRCFETNWGGSWLYKFTDPAGNIGAWWAGDNALEIEVGETKVFKATPKKHEEFRGVKTTTLSRVALAPPKKEKAARKPRKALAAAAMAENMAAAN